MYWDTPRPWGADVDQDKVMMNTHILNELRDIKTSINDLRDDNTNTRVEVATLKAKSITWGGLAGSLTGAAFSIIGLLLQYFFKHSNN